MHTEEWYRSITLKEQRLYKYDVERKIKKQRRLKEGDLVRLAPWSSNKFRIAQVVDRLWWDEKIVIIQYLDADGLSKKPSRASIRNLELIDENR